MKRVKEKRIGIIYGILNAFVNFVFFVVKISF